MTKKIKSQTLDDLIDDLWFVSQFNNKEQVKLKSKLHKMVLGCVPKRGRQLGSDNYWFSFCRDKAIKNINKLFGVKE